MKSRKSPAKQKPEHGDVSLALDIALSKHNMRVTPFGHSSSKLKTLNKIRRLEGGRFDEL